MDTFVCKKKSARSDGMISVFKQPSPPLIIQLVNDSRRGCPGHVPGHSYVPWDGVPLWTVVPYGKVERRVGVKHSLEADVTQHKEQTGTEHCSDKAPRVTWKAKRRGTGTAVSVAVQFVLMYSTGSLWRTQSFCFNWRMIYLQNQCQIQYKFLVTPLIEWVIIRILAT